MDIQALATRRSFLLELKEIHEKSLKNKEHSVLFQDPS
jgi:hypothetical protein